ncbi:MAG: hypothetical protein R2834_02935 [Rhodothermales bacterium]
MKPIKHVPAQVPRSLGIVNPDDVDDLWQAGGPPGTIVKAFDARIESVWDQYVEMAKTRGVMELQSAREVLIRWRAQLEKDFWEYQEYDPYVLETNAKERARDGAEEPSEAQRRLEEYRAGLYEKALVGYKETEFRLSVLENVLWRLIMFGQLEPYGRVDKKTRRVIASDDAAKASQGEKVEWVRAYIESNPLLLNISTNADLFRATAKFKDLGIDESTIPKGVRGYFKSIGHPMPRTPSKFKQYFGIQPSEDRKIREN